MTFEKKLQTIKTTLGINLDDVTIDNELSAYLDMAANEILNWMYINHPSQRGADEEVPARYENTQVMAVVHGYSHKGAEGETVHNENGINRTFVYADMLDYIRSNVFQIL